MNENDLLLKEKLKKGERQYYPDDNDPADNWPDNGEPAGLPLEKAMGPAAPKKDSKILFFNIFRDIFWANGKVYCTGLKRQKNCFNFLWFQI